jgi:hypothetical protein
MSRRKFTWTDAQKDKLYKVLDILEELKAYQPLTLRQVYYQMVGKGYIENNKSQYNMLSDLIKWARIDKYIPWEIIEDRVRAFRDYRGWSTKEDFIGQEVNNFLAGYRRNLLQTQAKYIEVWIEKDALSSLFSKVCLVYSVPVVVCRGFASVSFLNDFKERLAVQGEKTPLMLYFGDFDPSGMEMLEAMITTLREELEVGLLFKRIALTKEDISTHNLPHNPKAIKQKDTRAKKHIARYGELAVELDALRPNILEAKIREAIEQEINIKAFNTEVKKANLELRKLREMKRKAEAFIGALNV